MSPPRATRASQAARSAGKPPVRARRAVSTAGAASSLPAAAGKPAPPGEAVQAGQRVADFSLPSTGGGEFRLSEARGSKLVLYFYPRDNTPGCTQEGRDFAQLAPQFAKAGTRIVGISRDSLASHERFRAEMAFPFPLLSDADERVCRQFDVIRPKLMYGRQVVGVERSTFLLDASGVLRRSWRKVKVTGHAREVLEAAQAL